MTKRLIAFLFFLLVYNLCFATHNRAGYIQYTHVPGNSNTYQVTIITYTREQSVSADRDSLPIEWGDGFGDTLPRTNGPIVNGNHKGVDLGNGIKYNTYVGIHIFPAFGQYILSMTDPNRIGGILNMFNSIDMPFFLEDTLTIPDPAFYLGYNNSPIISKPPVDFAETNQLFIYNPGAYDPDGDSLSYQLVPPKQGSGIPVDGYMAPNKIPGTSANRTFTINPLTGEVRWNSPEYCGIYNIAILITEWRRVYGAPRSIYAKKVGTTLLDMEIIVNCATDHPPKISALRDTCIIAGTKLVYNITATDTDIGQNVYLSAVGGPFDLPADIASFTTIDGTSSDSFIARGTFTWNTQCDDIYSLPYQVVFTAIDNYPDAPLTDVKVWNIKVVGPPPHLDTAKASGNSITLTWDSLYSCSNAAKFIGFAVWRREGCTAVVMDTCVTGLAGQGYTRLVDRWLHYHYVDNNVKRGIDYAYRVLAEFSDTNSFGYGVNYIESLASNQKCATLKKDIPVITNASIRNTDNSLGSVYVAWSKPVALLLDTNQNPGPYYYLVYHLNGFSGTSFAKVDSIGSGTFYQLTDTTLVDTPVNTVSGPWSYKVQFYSNKNFIGETEAASSVFLTIASASHRLKLSWKDVVPWTNSSYTIFRQDKKTSLWDSIGVTSSTAYTDNHLENDSTYCYYVRSTGSYSAPGLIDPIINLSQRVCAVPVDTIGPCPPVLTIKNECNTPGFQLGLYVNQLIWSKPNVSCESDLLKYHIYYAAKSTDPFTLLDSTHYLNDTTFNDFRNDFTIAGCYAVSGVDSTFNEGPMSIPICVSNCPTYDLPNVFTPNHDDKNDLFHPFLPYKYIDRIDIKIYDSWGVLVFQTTDPIINWDGTDVNNHKDCPQGTYYYVCDVFESNPGGDIKNNKPLSGFIHLYR